MTVKPLEDLTFSDDFMFGCVMQNERICKRVIEILLDIEIDKIARVDDEPTDNGTPQTQKVIDVEYYAKAVRLDVYLKGSNTIYNIEMQTTNSHNLPLRSRYYQGVVDIDILKSGKMYTELKESFIIFICRFDPFNKKLPVYTIKPSCIEDSAVDFNDMTNRVFFNSTAYTNVDGDELKAFLNYIETGSAYDKFTQEIDNEINSVKSKERVGVDYMTWNAKLMDERMEGKIEGIEIGIVKGKHDIAKGLLDILDDNTIAIKTKLPIDEVRKLRQESK